MAARLVTVALEPRDNNLDAFRGAAAKAAVKAGFGPAATEVLRVSVDDGVIVAEVRFVADADAGAALLNGHADDERLWHSWVESLCTLGVCRVSSSKLAR